MDHALARRQRRTLLTRSLAIGYLVLTAAFIVVSVILLNTVTTTRRNSERNDCKTEYSSILAKPVQLRDNLAADLESQLGAALLTFQPTVPTSPTVRDRYLTTKAALDTAITAVQHLPTLDQAAQHGFVLNGKHYPACTKV